MIEIELKYELKNKIKCDLKPDKEKEVEDVYYDTEDYHLLKNGNFLRVRNGKQLDFKINANDMSHLYCKETNFSYDNKNVSEIKKLLKKLDIDISFTSLDELFKNLKTLAPIKKKRHIYKLEEKVVMVIDEVENLGIFLEIEYDYENDEITKEQGEYYKNYLKDILKKYNLLNDDMLEVKIGYVELYLKKYNKKAYDLGIYKD